MLKGTDSTRARVLAMRVLPTPEGPSRRMLDFSMVRGVGSRIGGAPRRGSDAGACRGMVCCWPGNSSGGFQSANLRAMNDLGACPPRDVAALSPAASVVAAALLPPHLAVVTPEFSGNDCIPIHSAPSSLLPDPPQTDPDAA